MKKITTHIAVALLLCALSAAAVAAKGKSHKVTFKQDLVVGGTTVKSGTYGVSYDEQTRELTISDLKTKAVVAKAPAQATQRGAGNRLQINTSSRSGSEVLTAIAFEGGKQIFTVGDATATDAAREGEQKAKGTNQ